LIGAIKTIVVVKFDDVLITIIAARLCVRVLVAIVVLGALFAEQLLWPFLLLKL
jgi:hypothetical protein